MNLFGETEPALCEHNQIIGTYCSQCDRLAHELTTAAINQAEQNATNQWMDLAWQTLKMVAEQSSEFTSDDIWAIIDRYPNIQTHEPRAMGAIFRKGVKHGWIKKTGRYISSTRPIAHCKPTAIWQSLAYEGTK